MFEYFPKPDNKHESDAVDHFVIESNFDGITTQSLYEKVELAGFSQENCELIAGDICETAADYVDNNPGLRISLLHLDLDVDIATFAALKAFWPRVVPGGIVIFDEYAIPRWTESNAVDRFFADKTIKLQTPKLGTYANRLYCQTMMKPYFTITILVSGC